MNSILYGADGQLIPSTNINANDSDVFGKIVKDSNDITRYFLKRITGGQENGRLLNPQSMWHTAGIEKAYDKRHGRKTCEFSQVTKTCFELYMKFLSSKNIAYLRNAEREIQ